MNKLCQEVFKYIKQQLSFGAPPSMREICNNVNAKSTSTIHNCVKQLEEEGFIKRLDNSRRTIVINTQPQIDVPILNSITPDIPINENFDILGYIPYSNFKDDPDSYFAITLKDDCMKNIGLLSGDIAIFKNVSLAPNEQVVIALYKEQIHIGRLFKEADSFKLKPENDNMQSNSFASLNIIGVLVASFRNYE